ncbi:MAG: iron-containing alcohol dehydrogenase [Lachnospiraceae bacterium]|jgi:alcohol dehydrogenase class IV|nr:iron-containing alcohol dehydrogenase [Lachnospiraceae bacterium]
MQKGYQLLSQSQLVTGRGSVSFLAEMGKKRAAIFYDGRVFKEKEKERVANILNKGGCECRFVADIQNEPFFGDIERALGAVREFEPDLIAAIGGGSVIDTAKAAWLFYEHPELSFEDAFKPFQIPPATGKAILAALPTTSGTGSETTCCAVFVNEKTTQKQLILGFPIVPAYAILDPDFTDTLPDVIAAHTGMDALSHAIEAAVCVASTPIVKSLAIEAALDLFDYLPDSVGADVTPEKKKTGREICHYAATIAGIAINNSSAGLVHALDQMGPYFNLPHGLVCGLLLPYTTAFHSPHDTYIKLAKRLGVAGATDTETCAALSEYLWNFNIRVGIPTCFKDLGIAQSEYMEKISDFLSGLDSSMAANLSPLKPSFSQAKEILEDAYLGNKPF